MCTYKIIPVHVYHSHFELCIKTNCSTVLSPDDSRVKRIIFLRRAKGKKREKRKKQK